MRRTLFLLLCVIALGCVAPVRQGTPSGNPEVTIATADFGGVKNALVTAMVDRGYRVTQESDHSIAFDKPGDEDLSPGFPRPIHYCRRNDRKCIEDALDEELLWGDMYGDNASEEITYTLVTTDDGVRVVANPVEVTKPARRGSVFQRRVVVWSSAGNSQDIQNLLNEIRDRYHEDAPQ